MFNAFSILFFVAMVLFLLPYLIYPPLLYCLSRCRSKRPVGAALPSATIVISAYNESEVIREKIENTLQLDYPAKLLEIMVISDASDDGTDEIVKGFSNQRVRLCRQEERLGKSAGLSRFCPCAQGDVLVFTDANSMFAPNALTKLLRHFEDERVGYTVGRQVYDIAGQGASADSENVYWNIELLLKSWESRLSSVVGADGAIYALRKELFEPLTAEDINDFYLPLRVVAKGYRGVFDTEAVCTEAAAPDFRGEFRRKYRIVNRSLRAVLKVPSALNPLRVGWFAFQLFSHKFIRWLAPIFLATMLVASLGLAVNEHGWSINQRTFTIMLCLQLLGFSLAFLYVIPLMRRYRLVYIAYYFLLVNVAAVVGIGLLISGRTIGTWKPQR